MTEIKNKKNLEVEQNLWAQIREAESVAIGLAAENGWLKQYHAPPVDDLKAGLTEMFAKKEIRLCCSGTVGVELALRGCGVKPGDRVLLSGYDFPGNFRCIESIGARPVIVDVWPNSWMMDLEQAEEVVKKGDLKAVVISLLHGSLFNLSDFYQICREAGVLLILDGCQVPGAIVDSQPICDWCDAFCISFGGSKLLSAGRGGAVLTDDPAISQRMEVFSFRGNDAYPLSTSQAVILVPQVEFLGKANLLRFHNAFQIWKTSEKYSWLGLPEQVENCDFSEQNLPAFYKYGWILGSSVNREAFLKEAERLEIPFGEGFKGFHLRSGRRCERIGDLPNVRAAASQTVLLPHNFLSGNSETDKEVLGSFERFLANFDKTIEFVS